MNAFKLTLAASALMLLPATSAFAATAEECAAMFKQADVNADGSLAAGEAEKFEEAMTKTDIQRADAKVIMMNEFNMACEKGTFDGM
jgi:hypothetical protein